MSKICNYFQLFFLTQPIRVTFFLKITQIILVICENNKHMHVMKFSVTKCIHNILRKTEKLSTVHAQCNLDSFLCIYFFLVHLKPFQRVGGQSKWWFAKRNCVTYFWCTIPTHTSSNLNFKNFHNCWGWKECLQKYVAHSKLFLIYANLNVWVLSHSMSLIKFIRNKTQRSMKMPSRST